MIKYSSNGGTWIECAPYCPPLTNEPITIASEKGSEETVAMVTTVETVAKVTVETVTDVTPKEEMEQFRSRSDAVTGDDIKKRLSVELPISIRSQSVSYPASVPVKIEKRTTLRRKSMNMIRQGHTGEKGSKEFKLALQKDAQHEIHPGWNSVRKLASVVG